MRSFDIHSLGEERRRKRRVWLGATFLISGWIVFFGAVWVVRSSGIFTVKDIHFDGDMNISERKIIDHIQANMFVSGRWKTLLGMQNILIWPEELEGESLKTLPEVRRVMIEKNYESREVIVRVEERAPESVWCYEATKDSEDSSQKTECFWFDKEGVAIRRAFAGEGSLIAIVRDYAQRRVPLGTVVIEPRLFENMQTALKALRDSEIRVKEIRLEDLSREEISISTHDGPDVYVSLRFPLRSVEDTIHTIQKETSLGNVSYIDLRVEGRAYYR